MRHATPDLLAHRRVTGADRYNEAWDSIIHPAQVPTRTQVDFEANLLMWLHRFWMPVRGARGWHQINVASVGGWPNNYRIPDLVLLLPNRFGIDRNEYFEGAPTAVVEIHSPGDESYDKLPFYFDLGVPEVWVIHRDTKAPEIYVPGRKRHRLVRPNGGGWLKGPETRVELKQEAPDKLAVRIAGDGDSRRVLPEH